MKTKINYSKNQKRNLSNSFKMGWYNAQASLELNMKNSALSLGVSITASEGMKWEAIPLNRS